MVIDFGNEGEDTPIVVESDHAVNSGASNRERSIACYTGKTDTERNRIRGKTCGQETITEILLEWHKLISASSGEQTL